LYIVDRLQGYGFSCAQEQIESGKFVWHCKYETPEYQFSVNIWGDSPETVDLVEAIAFYYGDLADYSDLTSVIFGLIAEAPYAGATPENARQWVEQAIPGMQMVGDEALTSFAGVRYYIYALPSSHVLEIGSLQN
jgi:hypothetical protein